ncbi:ABC transporter ATP-binding protein [Terrarubrum flagellatum]|uniref:ABC transporter ATP-binding protein n=1 Tax=Terrirubrum flagellatum TaxID=2895980 RepID=UPI0031455F39
MRRFLETRLDPVAPPPAGDPPDRLIAFYWRFLSQAKGVFALLVVVSIALAFLETSVPYFIGRLVHVLETTPRDSLLQDAWPTLATMVFVVLVLRPFTLYVQRLIVNQTIVPPFNTMIRWQSHFHVVRQSLGFFQSDFAGRIANRVMQAGPAVRETLVALIRSVLHIIFYGLGSVALMLAQDWRLAAPMVVWFALYMALMALSIPRMRDLSRAASEKRSAVTGKVVDSYSNILTVKLFAKNADEDRYVRDSMVELSDAFMAQMRMNTLFVSLLTILNAILLTATGAIAVWLWTHGRVDIGTLAMALPLTSQIIAMSGWVAFEIQGIFENVGMVQESMLSIAKPLTMQDEKDAQPLAMAGGEIKFDHVSFGYGRTDIPIIDDLSLTVRAGEKVGLVGRSGAGKSTIVSLLLRFHDVESGAITIDQQNVSDVTQETLRGAISVVTQDTSLLHRSIRDNITYGRPEATDEMVVAAAERAQAAGFITGLQDSFGREGYDAHVGERGVKLSGGQRQRIAIARVILKDAPILVLDEATSALDSEVEAAIQDSLADLMRGKTVIAIAHRLSTLQIMDRLIVMDRGRIIEEGTHADLIARNGLYAELWARQSGGFIIEPKMSAKAAE